MDYKSIVEKYKDQPMFKATLGIFIIVCIVKIAMLGFEFGQWLHK
ncbi:MAG: hypothetical protein JWP45_3115 [Mucilaginibacter sp.]|nr:hypothetical protein [Mucilaginibacter sp.]